jgi:hypothetical protein
MNSPDFAAYSVAHGGPSRPFDAWTVRGGEVEPAGSHATIAAAVAALAGEPEGGGVFVGRRFERWAPGTPATTQRAVLAALRRDH